MRAGYRQSITTQKSLLAMSVKLARWLLWFGFSFRPLFRAQRLLHSRKSLIEKVTETLE